MKSVYTKYKQDIELCRRGSIITCHVQKHRTEIITISKSDGAKTKTVMYKMDVNVHYVKRNTSLGVF